MEILQAVVWLENSLVVLAEHLFKIKKVGVEVLLTAFCPITGNDPLVFF